MKTRLMLLCAVFLLGCSQGDWRSASRASAGLAPDPATTPEAVLQVYGASAYGWRGWFAIHTWIAAKPANAERYTLYEVIGWRERRGLPVLRIEPVDSPDRYWFGAKPELLLDRRGAGVEELIQAVDQAARAYPWKHEYRVFPGPNSNTFPAWVGAQVPELGLELPFRAIGSGWTD
ncbi:DUF3750 domain-containing protein [Marinobacterium sedimentorum]|uniref:DUF3750 domain-containing protein n=1 Tax=Marinobacterium sedimentorum TaxID=2927804 RepID=UPI0020C660A7|nr:DUF3750 domain-containing protein [Marinobacterium sedimentorum]MCP8690098.1 DUF3750 domain-containing protein [Marinobacterium sedimentorum]